MAEFFVLPAGCASDTVWKEYFDLNCTMQKKIDQRNMYVIVSAHDRSSVPCLLQVHREWNTNMS